MYLYIYIYTIIQIHIDLPPTEALKKRKKQKQKSREHTLCDHRANPNPPSLDPELNLLVPMELLFLDKKNGLGTQFSHKSSVQNPSYNINWLFEREFQCLMIIPNPKNGPYHPLSAGVCKKYRHKCHNTAIKSYINCYALTN